MSTIARHPLQIVEDNFRRPTGRAGRLLGHLMALQHRSLTRWTIEAMHIRADDRVLDIGCGGGTALGLLVQAASLGQVVGIDYSPEMVAQAKARHAQHIRRGALRVSRGDAMALPEPDARFDRVCAIETFYFWPDPLRGLLEAHRVLRPGGRITVAVEMSREAAGGGSLLQRLLGTRFMDRSAQQGLRILSGEELTRLLRTAGFRETTFVAEPGRSLGWLCASGQK